MKHKKPAVDKWGIPIGVKRVRKMPEQPTCEFYDWFTKAVKQKMEQQRKTEL